MNSAPPGMPGPPPDFQPAAGTDPFPARSDPSPAPPNGPPRQRRMRALSSIGLRLSLLGLALGLPFIVYIGINAADQSASLRAQARQHSLSLARLFAARVDDYVGDMLSSVAVTSHGIVTDAAYASANDEYLRRIRPDLPKSVNNVAVWTVDGTNVGSTDPGIRSRGVNIGDRDYFRAAVRDNRLTIGGPLVSRINSEPVVIFARPVDGVDGRVTGIVTASTRLRDLQWLLDLKGIAPPGTLVSLLNDQGVVLLRNIDASRWIGVNILGAGKVREHIAAGEGTDETNGRDGIARMAGFTQTSRAPWHVFVGIPTDTALSGVQANFLRTLVIGLATLLVGAALAAYAGVRIAQPLRQLAHDARLLARGHLAHRTSVSGDDETGVLAHALNRMAETVEERTRALEEKSAALANSAGELALITANVPVLIAYVSADHRFTFVNEYIHDVFGVAPDRVIGRTLRQVLGETVFARLEERVRDAQSGLPQTFEASFSPDEASPWFMVSCFPDYGTAHEVRGAYVVCQDITARREIEEALALSEHRTRMVTDNIPSMIGYIDGDRRYRFNNRYYEFWLNRPLSEITGRPVRDVLGPAAYANVEPNLDRAFAGERVDFDVEVTGPGGTRHVRGTYIPDFGPDGRVIGVYSSSNDVTPLKEAERELERLAQRDTLTGLPNRHMFNAGISRALQRSQRNGTPIALLFLDIDGFKGINDTLGHAAGDDVLREFARRLSESVRPTDLVARLAGDEFVIVLEGVHGREECRFVARKIIAAMSPAFRAGDTEVPVTASIGIALGDDPADTAETLLKRADSALYAAKGRGRNTYEIAI